MKITRTWGLRESTTRRSQRLPVEIKADHWSHLTDPNSSWLDIRGHVSSRDHWEVFTGLSGWLAGYLAHWPATIRIQNIGRFQRPLFTSSGFKTYTVDYIFYTFITRSEPERYHSFNFRTLLQWQGVELVGVVFHFENVSLGRIDGRIYAVAWLNRSWTRCSISGTYQGKFSCLKEPEILSGAWFQSSDNAFSEREWTRLTKGALGKAKPQSRCSGSQRWRVSFDVRREAVPIPNRIYRSRFRRKTRPFQMLTS